VDGAGELVEMLNDPIRVQFRHRDIGIAEGDADHRDSRRAGGIDIGAAISNHDRAGGIATGKTDRFGDMAWIGLAEREGLPPRKGGETRQDSKLFHKSFRMQFGLVGANGEDETATREIRERPLHAWIKEGIGRDILKVIRQQHMKQLVEFFGRQGAASRHESAFDQRAAPRSDQPASGLDRQRGQSFLHEQVVERGHDILCRLGQGSVEIENQGSAHSSALFATLKECVHWCGDSGNRAGGNTLESAGRIAMGKDLPSFTGFLAFVGFFAFYLASPVHAENYAFAPAPQQDLNRMYRVDRANGEVVACQFAVKDDSPIGLTLCYPAGEGAKAGEAGDYALIASSHRQEGGIFRVNRRSGAVSVCYVREDQEVVCTPQAR
jgi:hypothetical protein